MTIQECTKEAQIEGIDMKVSRLYKSFYGNGEEGWQNTQRRLDLNMKDQAKDLAGIRGDLKVLLRFQTQVETKEDVLNKVEEKQGTYKRWITGLMITTGLSILSLVIAVIKMAG